LLVAADGASLFVLLAIVALVILALVYAGGALVSAGGGTWVKRALMRRVARRLLPAIVLSVLPLSATLADAACGARDLRGRPGNDDLFVFVDSSLSMGPTSFGDWASGDFERSRQVLHRLADCYLKRGDFVLVASFDSEVRIEIAKTIVDPERDRALLRRQIDGLGPTRPRYWERRPGRELGPERATGERSRRWVVGGSLHTDLVAALENLDEMLGLYRQPDHRQTVLLFTDGRHDPPEFVTGDDDPSLLLPSPSADFSLGVVVLSGGSVEPWLVRAVDERREGAAAVRLLRAEDGVDAVLDGDDI